MKIGSEDRKKLIAAGSFGVVAIGYLIYTLAGSGGPDTSQAPLPSPAPSGLPAAIARPDARSTPSRLDPMLHPEGMLLTESLVYSGSGRNIFLPAEMASAPLGAAKIPRALAPARYVPPAPVSNMPAPPPAVDLRFFGTSTRPDGKRQAFFVRGDDVFIASTGDVVNRRYRVGTITLNSVEVTDLTDNNMQRLPMSTQ